MWRVSSILEINGLSTPHKNYGEEPLRRGTAIHAATEALAEGYTPRVAEPHWQPFVDGVVKWFAECSPTVVATERRIVSRLHRLTGRIDLFALVLVRRNPDVLAPVIIDVKTGGEAVWHGIQTAGYHLLALEDEELWKLFGEQFDGYNYIKRSTALLRYILYLPGDGSYAWREKKDPVDGYRFRSALSLTQFRYDNGLLSYKDPENPDDDTRSVLVDQVAF